MILSRKLLSLTAESQTLPGGVCNEVRACLQEIKQGNKTLDRKTRHKLGKGTPFQ